MKVILSSYRENVESQNDFTRLLGWASFDWFREGVSVEVGVASPVVGREDRECFRPKRKKRQKKITSSSKGCCCSVRWCCCWCGYSGGDRVIRSERFEEWLVPAWLFPNSGEEYVDPVTIAGLLPVRECRSGLLLLVLPLLIFLLNKKYIIRIYIYICIF